MMEEIFVPVALFVMIFGIVAIVMFYRFRNRQELQLTVRATLESGQTLSAELLEQLTAALHPKRNDIRRGIVLLAIGFAFVLFAFAVGHDEASGPLLGLAAFPVLVGLAYLLLGFLARNSDK